MTSSTTDRVNSVVEPSPSTVATLTGGELQVDAQALAEALDPELVARLAATAREQGVSLLGRDGLLRQVTKRFLEAALQAEMDEQLGYGKHEGAGRNWGNSRNGKRSKTLLTDVGKVEIEVPRDRDGTFTPAIVPKRQRRFGGIDDLVISLTAKGANDGGGGRASGRGLRRGCVQGPYLHHHGEGDGVVCRVAEPAAGPGLPGDLH